MSISCVKDDGSGRGQVQVDQSDMMHSTASVQQRVTDMHCQTTTTTTTDSSESRICIVKAHVHVHYLPRLVQGAHELIS